MADHRSSNAEPRTPNPEPRNLNPNREPRTTNPAPNLNTNREQSTRNREPPRSYNEAVNQEVFGALAEALAKGEEVALVTITGSTGSTPQRVGAKMLVYSDGRTVGTIGGGCYENDAFWKAREAIKARRPLNVKYELNDDFAQETGLVCGGQMEVFIEPVESSPDVYIFGAGHVGQFVARMAHEVGFRVHVIDDREKFANAERFGEGIEVVVDHIPTWLQNHQLPPTAYAVIVTRRSEEHTSELQSLAYLVCRLLLEKKKKKTYTFHTSLSTPPSRTTV